MRPRNSITLERALVSARIQGRVHCNKSRCYAACRTYVGMTRLPQT